MDLDSHYYAVLAFSRACGFKKESAEVIAFASQFVDDAKINHLIIQDEPPLGIVHDTIEEQPSFFGMSTCHSYTRKKTFNFTSMLTNTSAFHFVPGCEGPTSVKKLRCKEESCIIQNIMEQAMAEDNIIKFGVVLHPYADTFAHQGFSGILSQVNDIKNCKADSKIPWSRLQKYVRLFRSLLKSKFDRKFDNFMPAYGHGQAFDYPDIPHLEWSYEYDYSDNFTGRYKKSEKNNNVVKFKSAFEKITIYLQDYLKKYPVHRDEDFNFNKFEALYDTLLTVGTKKKRIKTWQKKLVELNLFEKKDPALTYDENLWLSQAFEDFTEKKFNHRVVGEVRLKPNFHESNWYQFYKVVKWYQEQFFDLLKKNAINIPFP